MTTSPSPARDKLVEELRQIVATGNERISALQAVAEALRRAGSYRWVGLYDVDRANGMVRNVVWSGPGAPEYPTFPIAKGLTGAAISSRKAVNVGDVASDPRYLTAFGSTRSEIIVPVFDAGDKEVVGTIDIESETTNAFDADTQSLLQACAKTIRPLWQR